MFVKYFFCFLTKIIKTILKSLINLLKYLKQKNSTVKT